MLRTLFCTSLCPESCSAVPQSRGVHLPFGEPSVRIIRDRETLRVRGARSPPARLRLSLGPLCPGDRRGRTRAAYLHSYSCFLDFSVCQCSGLHTHCIAVMLKMQYKRKDNDAVVECRVVKTTLNMLRNSPTSIKKKKGCYCEQLIHACLTDLLIFNLCVWMHVCVYVCLCVCVYGCMCVFMHVCACCIFTLNVCFFGLFFWTFGDFFECAGLHTHCIYCCNARNI